MTSRRPSPSRRLGDDGATERGGALSAHFAAIASLLLGVAAAGPVLLVFDRLTRLRKLSITAKPGGNFYASPERAVHQGPASSDQTLVYSRVHPDLVVELVVDPPSTAPAGATQPPTSDSAATCTPPTLAPATPAADPAEHTDHDLAGKDTRAGVPTEYGPTRRH